MKYLKQIVLIFLLSLIGELMHHFIPLPVPASIYGMVMLFLALCLGVIKLSDIEDVSSFLLDIMPMLFIPAGVGLISSWDILSQILIPLAVIILVSTVLVMGVSGRITQTVILRKSKKGLSDGGRK